MIDPATSIGAVHLTIADLDASIRFYESHLGFVVHRRDDRVAALGAGTPGGDDLIVLTQCETAPRVHGTTGLYHFAVLVPSRADLARSLLRLVQTETMMQGAADHGVSQSLYLADPDGNGIEIYRDRPRDEWPFVDGRLRMTVDPLDLDALLSEADDGPGTRVAGGTKMGHVHLHVSQLDAAQWFYVNVLGFDLTQRYGPSALFVSAGGYHHHIGLNTWAGVGAPPPPPGAIGLEYFDVRLPNVAARDAVLDRVRAAGVPIEESEAGPLVCDPSRNAILLSAS